VRLARARTGQGRLVEAYEIYRKVIRDGVEADKPEPFKRALADAKQEVKAVEPRLAWVSVNVVGAHPTEVEVSLNGAVIPSAALGAQRPVDPGTLHAKATADGYRPAEAEVQLAEGEHLPAIELRMVALPKPEPVAVTVNDRQPIMTANGGEPGFFSQRSLGYIGIGLGGAGILVGGITGILAYERHHDLINTPCRLLEGNHCWVSDNSAQARQAATDKQTQMRHFATAATVSFIAGGALAATGLLLLVTAGDGGGPQGSGQSILPYVGLGTIGAVGSF
jgi:hypothetical protein